MMREGERKRECVEYGGSVPWGRRKKHKGFRVRVFGKWKGKENKI